MEEYDDETMSAEEFFGKLDGGVFGTGHPRPDRRGGKRKGRDSFSEAKEKLVMRIYGVSRAKALEIIAKRTEKADADEQPESRAARSSRKDVRLMSPVDFFGEV